jgi:hypothetical protein
MPMMKRHGDTGTPLPTNGARHKPAANPNQIVNKAKGLEGNNDGRSSHDLVEAFFKVRLDGSMMNMDPPTIDE